MSERDVKELQRMTGLPVEPCREALEQNCGAIGAAHRVLIIGKNRDKADADRAIRDRIKMPRNVEYLSPSSIGVYDTDPDEKY